MGPACHSQHAEARTGEAQRPSAGNQWGLERRRPKMQENHKRQYDERDGCKNAHEEQVIAGREEVQAEGLPGAIQGQTVKEVVHREHH